MAQINKIKKNGTTIYPLTIPQAVINPETGEKLSDILGENHLVIDSVQTEESQAQSGTSTITLNFTNGESETLNVKNGKGITSITETRSDADGGTNDINIALSDGASVTVHTKNGNQGNSGYTGAAGELEVVNNLTDGGTTSALSAEQGKTLKTLVDDKASAEELSQLSQEVEETYGEYESSPEYIQVCTDAVGRFLWGIKKDGSIEWAKGIPTPIAERIEAFESALAFEENPAWIAVILDGNGKVVAYRKADGTMVENVGMEMPNLKLGTLELSDSGVQSLLEDLGIGSTTNGMLTLWEGSHAMRTLSVKKDGSGDFTNIQDAINSVTDASVTNQYEVQIYDDFYVNDLTQLWKVSSPTTHNTSTPTEQGAFVITKDFVHLRGMGSKKTISVESPDKDMAGTYFQHIQPIFVKGNCRIENLAFVIKGGRYAIHQDSSAAVDGADSYKTTIYKDVDALHLGNSDYTNGSAWASQCAQANGFANGQTQIYINVNWETRGAATAFYGHTNAGYTLPCKVVMVNCKAKSTLSWGIPSWGGFDFSDLFSCQSSDIFVYNCDIQQYTGRAMGLWTAAKAPRTRTDKRYCINRFIGGGNKPSVVRAETANILSFESKNAGEKIDVVGGTAYDDLWGKTHKQISGNGVKGICYGSNFIVPDSSSQVYNLAHILGNCASSPKTLIVEVTNTNNVATRYTITFDQNYMTSDGSSYDYNTTPNISQADIIAAVNSQFASYFTMADTMEFVDTFDDCKEEIRLRGSYSAEMGTALKKDLTLGYHGWRVANAGEKPDGFAMERIGVLSSGMALLAEKNIIYADVVGLATPLTTGAMYKVATGGTLVSTTDANEATLVAVDSSSIMIIN